MSIFLLLWILCGVSASVLFLYARKTYWEEITIADLIISTITLFFGLMSLFAVMAFVSEKTTLFTKVVWKCKD